MVGSPSGPFTITFHLLFELQITTSGPFSGFTVETKQDATFQASNLAALPFGPGTAFGDPVKPDAVDLFVKSDPTGLFPVGFELGTSSDRVVTVNSIVPEPSSLALGLLGAMSVALILPRRRARR